MGRPLIGRLAAAIAALALAGCAQNALLELQLELPPAPPDDGRGPWYALVQAKSADEFNFGSIWASNDDVAAVELGPEAQFDCVSIQSFSQDIDLNVRVRFCRSTNCQDIVDGTAPERFYRLERPFYIGRRTYYTARIPEVPECASDGECGGLGVCVDDRCGCELSTECPAGFACEGGQCVQQVGRCQIEGCIEGDSTTYCSDGDGAHFCETNASAERESSFQCDLSMD